MRGCSRATRRTHGREVWTKPPSSLSPRPKCKADPPRKHGPYYQLSYPNFDSSRGRVSVFRILKSNSWHYISRIGVGTLRRSQAEAIEEHRLGFVRSDDAADPQLPAPPGRGTRRSPVSA
jgi:hypothetical protein